jgi:ParB/RepB/Spo0J family partition protein
MYEEKKISEIEIKKNPRKDFGNIDELAASIKEKGIILPLLITKENVLIAGERRLKAAELAGLETVPVNVRDDSEASVISILENVQRKDLNAVEEGDFYKSIMKDMKIDDTKLAAKLGKTMEYVRRRVLISGLPDAIKKDLITKKIQMGHALTLAKMEKKDAENFVKEIKRQNYSVRSAIVSLHQDSRYISSAPFDKKDCKDCKYNGSQQAELFETGKALTGDCLNSSCFVKKVADFVKELKKKYKAVLLKENNTPKGFGEKWNCQITKPYMTKCRKDFNAETYQVYVSDSGDLNEYFKLPKSKDQPTDEKQQAKTRVEKLSDKIFEFKTDLLLTKCVEKVKPDITMMRTVLYYLKLELGISGCHDPKTVKEIYGRKEKEISKDLKELCKQLFYRVPKDQLRIVAAEVGVDLTKDFEISEEYLKPYTKDQLAELMKEFKIGKPIEWGKGSPKRSEYVSVLLELWKEGQVPKILEKN